MCDMTKSYPDCDSADMALFAFHEFFLSQVFLFLNGILNPLPS